MDSGLDDTTVTGELLERIGQAAPPLPVVRASRVAEVRAMLDEGDHPSADDLAASLVGDLVAQRSS